MKINSITVLVLSLVLAVACKKSTTDETDGAEASSNILESAMSEAGQQSTSSEGGAISASALMDGADLQTLDSQMDRLIDPQDSVRPFAACSLTARSTCTSNVSTIDWGGCTVGAAAMTGGWSETWSSCANGTTPVALASGQSVTRTSANGQVLTLATGAKLTTTTAAHSAYDGTAIPGTGVTVSNASGTRTVTINGLRRVFKGPRGGTWFDHSLVTNPTLTVTGTRAGGDRTVTGSLKVYHNVASYLATNTFNSVRWGSASCCYPTSGSISSALTGAVTGTSTMTFTSTCGSATFVGTDGASSTVTLSQCQ